MVNDTFDVANKFEQSFTIFAAFYHFIEYDINFCFEQLSIQSVSLRFGVPLYNLSISVLVVYQSSSRRSVIFIVFSSINLSSNLVVVKLI